MRPCIAVITQVYPPDPAAVGQQIADAAAELVRRGADVVVYTSRQGYENPRYRYARRSRLDGVDVRRLPFSSWGKRSIVSRVIGGTLFLAQAVLRILFTKRLDGVIVSTSPPMAPLAGVMLSRLRRVPLKWWVMDLVPDQLVATGIAPEDSPICKVFDAMNRLALRQAVDVIALDRFMADRIARKGEVRGRLHVLPPWAHEQHLAPVEHQENPFVRAHGLEGKFVVMYSGNHSPSHPLLTLLEAAARLRHRDDIRFVFVGGGNAKRDVDAAARAGNILSLPYQSLDQLRYSLSAAHVHVVSIGDGMVGVVHPCKVYGAMAVARPILLLGPAESHVGELLQRETFGWRVAHGDVDAMMRLLVQLAAAPRHELEAAGRRGRDLLLRSLSKDALCGAICTVLEHDLARQHARRPSPVGVDTRPTPGPSSRRI